MNRPPVINPLDAAARGPPRQPGALAAAHARRARRQRHHRAREDQGAAERDRQAADCHLTGNIQYRREGSKLC